MNQLEKGGRRVLPGDLGLRQESSAKTIDTSRVHNSGLFFRSDRGNKSDHFNRLAVMNRRMAARPQPCPGPCLFDDFMGMSTATLQSDSTAESKSRRRLDSLRRHSEIENESRTQLGLEIAKHIAIGDIP